MDEDQERTVKVLVDALAKLFLVVISGLILIGLAIVLVIKPTWPVAAFETVFAGTIFKVFSHYFVD